MRHLLILPSLLAVAVPSAAFATTVYPGCAVPSLKTGHHTFYVDPIKGSNNGDGSAAKPWHTLAEVLANPKLIATQSHMARGGTDALVDVNQSGPIKAGDVIMLRTGNHGAVGFVNYFNKDFITVMPAPGEKPILSSLRVTSSAKWLFQGLKVMAGATNPGFIVKLGYGDYMGATNNVIFDSGTVSTVDDTSSFSDKDWTSKITTVGIYTTKATCVAITNNHIYNVLNGITLDSEQSLAQGNQIDSMLNDGIDFTASNSLIKNNVIKNGVQNYASQLHADGIQGWSNRTNGIVQTVSNAVIDGNTITKIGDPSKTYMQGISIFDGNWEHLTVQNNVVSVNAIHALALYGVHDSLVVNNTILASNPEMNMSWIYVNHGKDGTPASNTIVRNNIATQIIVAGTNMTMDHNIASNDLQIPGATKPISSGSAGTSNWVKPSVLSTFETFKPSANQFDLRLRSSSPAIGVGAIANAPKLDMTGHPRNNPVDLGAITH